MHPAADSLREILEQTQTGLIESLEQRDIPAGAVLITEGDRPGAMYLIESGVADVLMADRHGVAHSVNRVGPGGVVGDLSLITGLPATASVRAATGLRVRTLSHGHFRRIAASHPELYQQLAVIATERLIRANRRSLTEQPGTIHLLRDAGGPPLLAYALACSIAWHTRAPSLVLAIRRTPDPALARLSPLPVASVADLLEAAERQPQPPGAVIAVAAPEGPFAPESLPLALDELRTAYGHMLVQAEEVDRARLPEPVVTLAPPGFTPPAAGNVCSLCAWTDAAAPMRVHGKRLVNIPALTIADGEAVARGLLPVGTPAGTALGFAARELTGLKVGLALGAGTERGYAHCGVLRALLRLGVPIDYLAGTSVGSGVAAAYGAGYSPEEIVELMDSLSRAMFRPTWPAGSLLSNAGLRFRLRKVVGQARIDEMPIPLAIIAADIIGRREVVFRHGPLCPALIASMAIPGIYPAQKIGPYTLVDGGVINPVPCNVAAEMGADIVIGVKLPSPATAVVSDATASEPSGHGPGALQVLQRAIELMQTRIIAETAAKATILLEPEFTDIGAWGVRNFRRGRVYVEQGEAAAEAAIPRLAAVLPWLRG